MYQLLTERDSLFVREKEAGWKTMPFFPNTQVDLFDLWKLLCEGEDLVAVDSFVHLYGCLVA